MTTAVALVGLQTSGTEALAPVSDSRHVLAPTPGSSLIATSRSSESNRHELTGSIQDCLDAYVTPGEKTTATSTWVRELQFTYNGEVVQEDSFHTVKIGAARDIVNSRIPNHNEDTNYVLAKVSGVFPARLFENQEGEQKYALVEFDGLLEDECYNSGRDDLPTAGHACVGWGEKFAKEEFINVLNKHLAVSITDEQFKDYIHAHSEQVLLAELYRDAQRCLASMSEEKSGCRLYQSFASENLCSMEVMILDVISAPNSVCHTCGGSFKTSRFFEVYQEALKQWCQRAHSRSSPLQKLVVRTSSLLRFRTHRHISCAGLHVNGIVDALMASPQWVTILHKLPVGLNPDGTARRTDTEAQVVENACNFRTSANQREAMLLACTFD